MEAGEVKEAPEAEEPAAEAPAVVEAAVDEYAEACKAGTPKVALIGKYSDRIAVQLTSKGHLETLQAEHPGSVEVQS